MAAPSEPDPKPAGRVRDPDALRRYRLLKLTELCELCELRPGVDAHHIRFRSRGGDDDERNLAWLCRQCHDGIHRHGLTL